MRLSHTSRDPWRLGSVTFGFVQRRVSRRLCPRRLRTGLPWRRLVGPGPRRPQSCDTLRGSGLGLGPGSVLRAPFSRRPGRGAAGLGGSAGGSAAAGMERL